MSIEGNEPVDELAGGIRQMLADLAAIIGQVTESTAQFHDVSRAIANGAQQLASGAESKRQRRGDHGRDRGTGPIG